MNCKTSIWSASRKLASKTQSVAALVLSHSIRNISTIILSSRNKPLKMVMSEVKKQASQFKHHKINIDIMLDIVQGYKQASFEVELHFIIAVPQI